MFDKFIIEENKHGRFYPRVRFLLFFYEYIDSPNPVDILVSFNSLQKARDYIKEVEKTGLPKTEKFHKA